MSSNFGLHYFPINVTFIPKLQTVLLVCVVMVKDLDLIQEIISVLIIQNTAQPALDEAVE